MPPPSPLRGFLKSLLHTLNVVLIILSALICHLQVINCDLCFRNLAVFSCTLRAAVLPLGGVGGGCLCVGLRGVIVNIHLWVSLCICPGYISPSYYNTTASANFLQKIKKNHHHCPPNVQSSTFHYYPWGLPNVLTAWVEKLVQRWTCMC